MSSTNKTLLIVVHSQSGRNLQLALAAFQAAQKETEINVQLLMAAEASAKDVLAADALLLFTPEMNGMISGGMKEFLDRIFYPLERAEKFALPYAVVISCGNAGQSAAQQIERVFTGIRANKIQEPLILHGEPTEENKAQCIELTEAMVAGLQMGMF